jgi:hypothetical protein
MDKATCFLIWVLLALISVHTFADCKQIEKCDDCDDKIYYNTVKWLYQKPAHSFYLECESALSKIVVSQVHFEKGNFLVSPHQISSMLNQASTYFLNNFLLPIPNKMTTRIMIVLVRRVE